MPTQINTTCQPLFDTYRDKHRAWEADPMNAGSAQAALAAFLKWMDAFLPDHTFDRAGVFAKNAAKRANTYGLSHDDLMTAYCQAFTVHGDGFTMMENVA